MLKQGRWAIAAVSMLLGIMLVGQYKMTQSIAESNIHLQRTGDLARETCRGRKRRDEAADNN